MGRPLLGGVFSVTSRAITHDFYGSKVPSYVLNPNSQVFIPGVDRRGRAPDTICIAPSESKLNPNCEVFVPRGGSNVLSSVEASPPCGNSGLVSMGTSSLNPLCLPFIPGQSCRREVVVYEGGVGDLLQATPAIEPLSTEIPVKAQVDFY